MGVSVCGGRHQVAEQKYDSEEATDDTFGVAHVLRSEAIRKARSVPIDPRRERGANSNYARRIERSKSKPSGSAIAYSPILQPSMSSCVIVSEYAAG